MSSKEIKLEYVPTKKQLEAHMATSPYVLFGGAVGGGKLTALETPVLTPNGYVPIKNIHPGDKVVDIDGKIVEVMWESEIKQSPKSYKLIFDTGTEVVADAEHQWYVRDRKNREKQSRRTKKYREKRKKTRKRRGKGEKREYTYKEPPKPVVLTTEEMFNNKHIKAGKNPNSPNYTIDVNKAIEFEEKDLPLDPYVLGCWLGDGSSNGGGFTNPDSEIIDRISKLYDIYEINTSRGYDWYIKGLVTDLRKLNLVNNKHIPHDYLFGSYEQRLALIQGLMDTDGCIGKNGKSEFSSCIKELTVGLKFLLNSIGIKTSKVYTNVAKLYGVRKQDRHRLNFRTKLPVFTVKRKLDRLPEKIRKTQNYHYIQDIEKVDSVPMKCIGVDSKTHTFLVTDSLIATHNSVWGVNDMLQCCLDFAGNRVGIFRYENSVFINTTMKTIEQWILNVDGLVKKHNQTKKTITLFNDSEIFYGGLKPSSTASGDSLKLIKSLELSACFIDEVTDVPENVFNFLCGRLERWKAKDVKSGKIVTPPRRLCCSCNPELGWVKSRWIDKNLDGYSFIPSKASENPHLPDSYTDDLRKTLPADMVERYVDGNWEVVVNFESVFPANWLNDAVNNNNYTPSDGDEVVFGVDVATFGDDKSVIAMRKGYKVEILQVIDSISTTDLATQVAMMADYYEPSIINIDSIGVGQGVCDRLMDMGYPVMPFVGGESPEDGRFLNRRSEAHWNVRKLLERKMLDLPDDPDLINEMGVIKYLVNLSERRIQVESKPAIKKRLGKSPDLNDAIVYACMDTDNPYVIGGLI